MHDEERPYDVIADDNDCAYRKRAEDAAMDDREQGLQAGETDAISETAAEGESASGLPDAIRENAGKVAIAAMLATSLTAVPPSQTDFPLPEMPPIVQVMDLGAGDQPPAVVDDQQDDVKASVWKKVLEILKYVLLALLLVGVLVFAGINGCASCSSGPVAAPTAADGSSSSASASASAMAS